MVPGNFWPIFNWSNRSEHTSLSLKEYGLENGVYLAHSFWDGQTRTSTVSGELWSADLPAHACLLLAVRRLQVSPQYIGSDVHVSQGLEVCDWQIEPHRITCQVHLGREACGSVYIRIPAGFQQAEWNGQPCQAELKDGVFRFPIDTGTGSLSIALV